MKLSNKVVLVTAASRGIGLAIARACAKEGASVYIASREVEEAQEEAEKLEAEGYRAKSIYNDAYVSRSYTTMVEDVIQDVGRIDVLVNNFGTSNPGKDLDVANTDVNVFLETVNLNLRSVFLSSQEVIPHMARQGGGSIINISSVGGLVPDVSQVAYGTSKAAINHLTKLIAVQEAKHNIRCNAILPGMTATASVEKHLTDEFKELFMRHIPFKRMAMPEEMAAAAVYFAADESSYVTGQLLTISGGFGMATPIYGDIAEKMKQR